MKNKDRYDLNTIDYYEQDEEAIKLPYRYIGTFMYVPELSDAKVTAFKRISTEVDLSQWR